MNMRTLVITTTGVVDYDEIRDQFSLFSTHCRGENVVENRAGSNASNQVPGHVTGSSTYYRRRVRRVRRFLLLVFRRFRITWRVLRRFFPP